MLTIVRAIAMTGNAQADFDRCGFTLTISDVGSTAQKAKDQLAKSVQEIEAIFTEVQALELQVIPEFTRKSMNTSNRGRTFCAEWTLSFVIDTPALAAQVHGMFSIRDDIEIKAPQFSLSDVKNLQAAAFTEAVQAAEDLFSDECIALNWDIMNHRICQVDQVRFDHSCATTAVDPPRPKTQAMSLGASIDGLESIELSAPSLDPGKAKVSVGAVFKYEKV